MITNSTETYGVMLTPHFEKYQTQDQETADIMQATWNFGNLLKGKGYKLAYMHGPIGLYEGVEITAGEIFFGQEDALQKFMDFALVKNSAGNYIKASLESVSLAADCDIPADTRVSITNSPVAAAYPISSFTWIMVYKEQSYNNRSTIQAQDLVYELNWMIHNNGQKYTSFLNYAPLPPKAVAAAEKVIKSITYGGRVVLQDEPVN